MIRRNRLAVVAMAAALTAGMAACSSDTPMPDGNAASGSPAATAVAAGSATDVAFAQSMIPHHEQAVEMADLALAPAADASPQVKKLAEQIKAAQGPEIQKMSGWLDGWGAPSAMPGQTDSGGMAGMDHSGHDMGGMTMSGMMTPEDMLSLSQSSGDEFDTMWIQMMIAHHEGAVVMAEQVKANSENPEVTTLADQIISAQRQEIQTMKDLLAS